MADEITTDNYYIIIVFGYIVLVLGTIGIFWGYMLSITKTKNILVKNFKLKKNWGKKFFYWFMNVLFWISILVYFMAYYFFTVWYVMNSEASRFWLPIN